MQAQLLLRDSHNLADAVVAAVGAPGLAWLAPDAVRLIASGERRCSPKRRRLLPDLSRLLSRLARDGELPADAPVAPAGLAMPLDVAPDFIPVLRYADDAVLVAAVLRLDGLNAKP